MNIHTSLLNIDKWPLTTNKTNKQTNKQTVALTTYERVARPGISSLGGQSHFYFARGTYNGEC